MKNYHETLNNFKRDKFEVNLMNRSTIERDDK